VNGDGISDVIVGALKGTSFYEGAVYVLYGGASLNSDSWDASSLRVDQGAVVTGPAWSYFGYSVSGAGDVNGDEYDDVIVGSVPFRRTYGEQISYLIYGMADGIQL
jgi:hypothetical protein